MFGVVARVGARTHAWGGSIGARAKGRLSAAAPPSAPQAKKILALIKGRN